MNCSNCGHEVAPDSLFCGQCGTKVKTNENPVEEKKVEEIICRCGNSLSPQAVFCNKCGAKVGAPAKPTPPTPPKINTTPIAKKPTSPSHNNYIPYGGNNNNNFYTSSYETPIPKNQQTPYRNAYYNNSAQPGSGSNIGIDISTTFWIMGLRITAYIACIAFVVVGCIFLSIFAEGGHPIIGFFILLASLVVGFLCTAGIMIFLDMAEDIHKIRTHIVKKNK